MNNHRNICASLLECSRADLKMRKFWFKWDRNYEAKYMFASYLGDKCSENYWMW